MTAAGADGGVPAAVNGRPRRTRIKICGVRSTEIAQCAAEAGADSIGLVRVPASPRFVDADAALSIAAALPPWVAPVAVFADFGGEEILASWPHDWVQLHGQELDVDPILAGRFVIKAVSATLPEDALLWWDRHPLVAAILLDAPKPGAGVPFDHRRFLIMRDRLSKPLIVAGGLGPSTVGNAIRTLRPWAVDVSSGVERERGEKDSRLIHEFCDAVRQADAG